LDLYGLKKKLAYVKDEHANINVMTIALKFIISCEIMCLEEGFQRTCFGSMFFERYRPLCNNTCTHLKYVFYEICLILLA
jgi:hypothetical protein